MLFSNFVCPHASILPHHLKWFNLELFPPHTMYLHVPTICLDIRVGPDKDVVDGEEDGEEGDGEDVDGHCEKSSNFLLVV